MGSKLNWGSPADELVADLMMWGVSHPDRVTIEDFKTLVKKLNWMIENMEEDDNYTYVTLGNNDERI